jgi:Cys-rich four helix bundle protein (predicted Tat secretion target)
MNRRGVLAWLGGLGGTAAADALGATHTTPKEAASDPTQTWLAQATAPAHEHDHAAMMAAPSTPSKFSALVAPYQECVRASQACIAHCQQLLAQGDKSLGTCLRTALDTEVVCSSVLKLSNLNSQFTPALARQSVAVMQACVDACKEHVEHHAECKACHDACLKAIEAAKRLA